jgi:general stress protein 26
MGQFASKGHDLFACLAGNLDEETDPARRAKHSSNEVEAWFSNGRDDPDLIMLRFEIDDAEIWTFAPGFLGTFKMLTGSAIRSSQLGDHAAGPV